MLINFNYIRKQIIDKHEVFFDVELDPEFDEILAFILVSQLFSFGNRA